MFLFVDWFHVKKGELQVTLDAERISPDGKTLLETYARDFQKTFEQGGHGFKPRDIPFGIRIVQEVAERTQPMARERSTLGKERDQSHGAV